jgi:hypothetical protein
VAFALRGLTDRVSEERVRANCSTAQQAVPAERSTAHAQSHPASAEHGQEMILGYFLFGDSLPSQECFFRNSQSIRHIVETARRKLDCFGLFPPLAAR